MFHIKKTIPLFLAVLCAAGMLTGCKITVPTKASSQVQSGLSNTAESASDLLSLPESEVSSVSSEKAVSAASKSVSSKPITNNSGAKTSENPSTQPAQNAQQLQPAPNGKLTVTLMISCKNILSHMNELDPSTKSIIPASGILYPKRTVEFQDGETVFDVLKHEWNAGRLKFEYQNTPALNSVYIISMFGLGRTLNESGWMYRINTSFKNAGCSSAAAKLKNGDIIEWHYTCSTGRDLNNLPAPGTMG